MNSNYIMPESWSKYNPEKLLVFGFDYTSQTDAQNLVFLNYVPISSEQIDDINDAESFASLDVSIPSNSSKEETQKWRFDVEQLQADVKTFKKTYVWPETNDENRLVETTISLKIKSRWINVDLIESENLTVESQLERLHKNVNNIITHLLNLNPFLTEIKTLMKKIMIIIADDWDIKSLIPQAILKKREETKK